VENLSKEKVAEREEINKISLEELVEVCSMLESCFLFYLTEGKYEAIQIDEADFGEWFYRLVRKRFLSASSLSLYVLGRTYAKAYLNNKV